MREKTNVQTPDSSNPSLLDTVSAPTNAPAAAPVTPALKLNDPSKAFGGKPAGASVADGFIGLGRKS